MPIVPILLSLVRNKKLLGGILALLLIGVAFYKTYSYGVTTERNRWETKELNQINDELLFNEELQKADNVLVNQLREELGVLERELLERPIKEVEYFENAGNDNCFDADGVRLLNSYFTEGTD